MKEWQKHVQDPSSNPVLRKDKTIDRYSRSYCGVLLGNFELALTGIEHAQACIDTNDKLQPCPECMKVINDKSK